jgi:hypothetical protein
MTPQSANSQFGDSQSKIWIARDCCFVPSFRLIK